MKKGKYGDARESKAPPGNRLGYALIGPFKQAFFQAGKHHLKSAVFSTGKVN